MGSTSVNKRGLMNVDAEYEARIDDFGQKLAAWRAVRVSSAHGTQNYDKAALTSQFPVFPLRVKLTFHSSSVLSWIWTSVSDYRISAAFPFITKLLPEFFAAQEILVRQNYLRCSLHRC